MKLDGPNLSSGRARKSNVMGGESEPLTVISLRGWLLRSVSSPILNSGFRGRYPGHSLAGGDGIVLRVLTRMLCPVPIFWSFV